MLISTWYWSYPQKIAKMQCFSPLVYDSTFLKPLLSLVTVAHDNSNRHHMPNPKVRRHRIYIMDTGCAGWCARVYWVTRLVSPLAATGAAPLRWNLTCFCVTAWLSPASTATSVWPWSWRGLSGENRDSWPARHLLEYRHVIRKRNYAKIFVWK